MDQVCPPPLTSEHEHQTGDHRQHVPASPEWPCPIRAFLPERAIVGSDSQVSTRPALQLLIEVNDQREGGLRRAPPA